MPSLSDERAADAPPPPPALSLRTVLLRGTFWTTAAICVTSAINVLVTAVLTRLLLPAEFGILAAVVSVTAFFELMAEVGLGSSLVQHPDLTRRELSSIFWTTVAGSVAVYLVLVAAAPLLGRLYAAPGVANVLPAIGSTVIVYGVLVVPLALMRRDLRFSEIAFAHTVAAATAGTAAISMAAAGFRHWALVGQYIVAVSVRTLILLLYSRWRPLLTLRLEDVRKVLGYASAMAVNVTINHWSRNVDAVLISRYLGVAGLGYYNLGQRLLGPPLQLINTGLRPLVHPTMARISDDVERMRRGFLDLVRITVTMTFPSAALLAVVASPLVAVIWGPRWERTVAVVHALALFAAWQPVNGMSAAVFMARNAAKLLLRMGLFASLLLIGCMAAGLPFGEAGVAWGFSFAYAVLIVPTFCAVAYVRLTGGRLHDLARALVLPAFSALVTLAAGFGIDRLLPPDTGPLARLAATGGAAFLALFVVIRATAWRLLLSAVRRWRE